MNVRGHAVVGDALIGDRHDAENGQPDDAEGMPEPGAEHDGLKVFVIITIGMGLQGDIDDEEPGNDEVHAVQSDGHGNESGGAGGRLLRGLLPEKDGEGERLDSEKGGAERRGQPEGGAKGPLTFLPDGVDGAG